MGLEEHKHFLNYFKPGYLFNIGFPKIIIGAPETMDMIIVVFIFYYLVSVFKTVIMRFALFAAINIKEAEFFITKSIH